MKYSEQYSKHRIHQGIWCYCHMNAVWCTKDCNSAIFEEVACEREGAIEEVLDDYVLCKGTDSHDQVKSSSSSGIKIINEVHRLGKAGTWG